MPNSPARSTRAWRRARPRRTRSASSTRERPGRAVLVGTWRWEPLDSTLDSILTLLTLATLLDGTPGAPQGDRTLAAGSCLVRVIRAGCCPADTRPRAR